MMKVTQYIILALTLLHTCHSWSMQNQRSEISFSRREYFGKAVTLGSTLVATTFLNPSSASAADGVAAEVTDKVFMEIKGLPSADGSASTTQRIVIGLFGKEAPQSADKLKKLMGPGLPAVCKPKEERMMQREQLEANKVYNTCIEGESRGVNYDYAQIWRIIKDERIDVGSVAGRFISREYPNWEESKPNGLKHDRAGLVSVRKGANSGFGFTVFPGGSGDVGDLDENHIICGQVLEGMDVIEVMNNLPVVGVAKVNYKGSAGGDSFREGPSRACRYGDTKLYCSENKPLTKLTMYQTGIL